MHDESIELFGSEVDPVSTPNAVLEHFVKNHFRHQLIVPNNVNRLKGRAKDNGEIAVFVIGTRMVDGEPMELVEWFEKVEDEDGIYLYAGWFEEAKTLFWVEVETEG
jgi:hypothetical protein